MAVPSTALEDAVALLTVSMHKGGPELDELVREFEGKDRSGELLLAVVALCRSLVFTTAKLVHALDDALTDQQVLDLTDAEVHHAAIEVVRAYARNVVPVDDAPAN